jgi:alpha-N-arabinofuranosidase
MERYIRFSRAFRAKHPEIALVGAAGPSPEDPRFIYAWQQMRTMKADFIDEHCYARPDWFLDNAHRYDNYNRADPKVFMGEYAAQSVDVVSPDNKNTWGCALAEAAYMTGMERNADVVRMASYAPLFAHVDGWQWTPDLIWVDNLRTLLTPSYQVQKLFARNRGDRVLPVKLDAANADESRRFYASSVYEDASGAVILKLVNALPKECACSVRLAGVPFLTKGTMTVLSADDLGAVNSFDYPDRVSPRETDFSPTDTTFELTLPASSLTVLRLGTAR